jgi:5-formyltetrahydrofolate cyclo-ligase
LEKSEVRREVTRRILEMDPGERAKRCADVQQRVIELPEFIDARCVAAYVALPFEVSTDRIMSEALARGKALVLPRTDWGAHRMDMVEVSDLESDLVEGGKGIMEPSRGAPADVGRIDFVVVPGRAFDRACNRVGQGGGFYDVFLRSLQPGCVTCAVAFDMQVFDTVPVREHDVKVGLLVTETEACRSTSLP